MLSYDLIVLGAGITGLSVAREQISLNPSANILIIEKEMAIGLHASGRNSGVLHSGIYYPSNSLKARFCSNGAKLMRQYCDENNLSIMRCGKVILPTNEENDLQLDVLNKRAIQNGVEVRLISGSELAEIEPEAFSFTLRALYSPDTAIVDPHIILNSIMSDLVKSGVTFHFGEKVISANPDNSTIRSNQNKTYKYGNLVNCTGQFSDMVSKIFDVGSDYVLLPFKGFYYQLSKKSNLSFNGLIYPVPDLNVPFLGVHSVKLVNGDVYFGPTAVPAFGREHYHGVKGVNFSDASSIIYHLFRQYLGNKQEFRAFTHQEMNKFIKKNFLASAKRLIPRLTNDSLVKSDKVGIRAQLLNKKSSELVMDFIIERRGNTTHVLNAVSPAFTSAFSFAKYILNT